MILAGLAYAAELSAGADSVVAAGTDPTGTALVPAWQGAWVAGRLGGIGLDAQAELLWPAGLDHAVAARLYALSASGASDTLAWTLGRQSLVLPSARRALDGGALDWRPSPALALRVAAGWGDHPVLPLSSGLPVAALEGQLGTGPALASLGAWVEGRADGGLVEHSHAALRLSPERAALRPEVRVLGSLAFDGTTTIVERARAEVAARPMSGTRARLYFDHRQALDEGSVLGGSILAALAPLGVDEAGAGLGWETVNRDALWIDAAATRTDSRALSADPALTGDTEQWGLVASAGWTPRCAASRACLVPTWRSTTSAVGEYHALSGLLRVPMPGPARLEFRGAAVPWRLAHAPWSLAGFVGAEGGLALGEWGAWSLGAEAGEDWTPGLDLRAYTRLRVAWPGGSR